MRHVVALYTTVNEPASVKTTSNLVRTRCLKSRHKKKVRISPRKLQSSRSIYEYMHNIIVSLHTFRSKLRNATTAMCFKPLRDDLIYPQTHPASMESVELRLVRKCFGTVCLDCRRKHPLFPPGGRVRRHGEVSNHEGTSNNFLSIFPRRRWESNISLAKLSKIIPFLPSVQDLPVSPLFHLLPLLFVASRAVLSSKK